MTTLISTISTEQQTISTNFLDNELLIASLSESVNSSLRMYSEHKKWVLEEINIDINIQQDEIENSTIINRIITLSGNLNEDQKTRLLVVANCCPIQKSLNDSIIVNTIII